MKDFDESCNSVMQEATPTSLSVTAPFEKVSSITGGNRALNTNLWFVNPVAVPHLYELRAI